VEEGLKAGDVVAGKLEVIRKIAGGGMGAVYEVEHKLTKHRRALKVLHKSQAMNRRYVERLLREASVAGRLDTPYVVETLDAGMLEDGAPYLLMELLRGVPLLDLIEREAPMDASRTVRIISQVCEGMAAAHAAGIVHRDLKPENILVHSTADGDEQVKIIDFGISHFREIEGDGPVSRLTTEGTIIGTPYYMSPEQASGKDVDQRADVYALGVILYEALTGRLPFIAETTGALFIKIGTGEYLPLKHRRRDIDAELADAVEKAFHKDIEERFESARELAEALAPYATSGGKKKPQRATADYESDPPRARTRPGVAPEAALYAETMDVETAVPRQKKRKDGEVPAPVVPESAAAEPLHSRDAPTEELEAAAKELDAPEPAMVVPPTAETEAKPLRAVEVASEPPRDSIDELPDSDPPSARSLPSWLGTTSLAALIAAVVAVTIVGIVGLGEGDDEEGQLPPVVQDPPEVTPTTDIVEVVDPIAVEEPGEDPESEEELTMASPEEEPDPSRPSMMRRGTMTGMQTAAEAAGLETDPYGP